MKFSVVKTIISLPIALKILLKIAFGYKRVVAKFFSVKKIYKISDKYFITYVKVWRKSSLWLLYWTK